MRAPLTLLAGLLLAGCSENPLAYQRPSDALKAALSLIAPEPCTRVVTDHGQAGAIESLPDRDCYRLRRAERFSGVWYLGEETSTFRSSPTPASLERYETWLDADEVALRRADALAAPALDAGFQVTFVGRRALFPGRFGHMGMSKRLIVMDQLISIERLSSD